MTNLDQLLTEDAHEHLLTPTLPLTLDCALARAQASTRHRRALTLGATITAGATLTGGLLYAGTAPASKETADGQTNTSGVQLAVYDRVLGPDPAQAGSVLVVGPADEHTANCGRVAGAHVTLTGVGTGGSEHVTGYKATIPARSSDPNSPVGNAKTTLGAVGIKNLPPGPYYVFTCPKP